MEYRTKSIFGKYSENLQVLVDTNIEKFKAPFFPRYFSMGSPQVGLTYATVIGRARIEAAASVVAHGSEAPLRSRAGLERLSGEIASIKVKRQLDEKDYREYLGLQAMSVSDEVKKSQILQFIWNDAKYVADSVSARLDIMAAQALSTGTIPINATTNPDGVVPGTIDLLVPALHKKKRGDFGDYSTKASNLGTTSWAAAGGTPISDIKALTRAVWDEEGIVYERILMDPATWWNIQKTTEVTNAFSKTLMLTDGQPTIEAFNAYLQSMQLPVVEIVNVRAKIEKNGVLANVKTWEDKKYVTFVPGGELGKIHNAIAIEQISPVAGVNYATVNNILVSKWAQTEPFGEYTRGEIAAFPGLEVSDQMFILDVETA